MLHELLDECLPAAWVVAVGLDVGDGREVALPPQSALLGDVDKELGTCQLSFHKIVILVHSILYCGKPGPK